MNFLIAVFSGVFTFFFLAYGIEIGLNAMLYDGSAPIKWLLLQVVCFAGFASGYLASTLNMNKWLFSSAFAAVLCIILWMVIYFVLGGGLGVVLPILLVPTIFFSFISGSIVFFIRNFKYSI